MSELDDLRHRVEALETAVAGIDRDQADNTTAIRVTHRLVQALVITQSEHTATLGQHTATLGQHTATLTQHTAMLAQHTEQLTELKVGQQTIVAMLTQLIEREDQ